MDVPGYTMVTRKYSDWKNLYSRLPIEEYHEWFRRQEKEHVGFSINLVIDQIGRETREYENLLSTENDPLKRIFILDQLQDYQRYLKEWKELRRRLHGF
jgi:hypothetical protein